MYRKQAAIAVLFAALAAAPMTAAITPFTDDKTGFEAGLANLTVIDFEGLVTPPASMHDYSNSPLTIDGVEFKQTTAISFMGLFAASGGSFVMGTGQTLVADGAATVQVTLPSVKSGFGFNAKTTSSYPTTLTITIPGAGGGSHTFTLTTGTSWLGVTSDTPFDTVQIQMAGDYGVMDNVLYGDAGSSPEPTAELSTFLLIGTGLFMMRYGARYIQPAQWR